MMVPWSQVPPESLQSLIEEYVTRDGTDYGEHEISLERRVEQMMAQLKRKEVVIWFDQVTETITLMSAQDATLAASQGSPDDD
ncbi:MAG: YheU family protein [Alcanivoracaceae bacterium]|nr:YheU family protein [Alcanivoracaceae bacterium]